MSLATPLAERIRPKSLAEFIGQQHLVGEGTVLRRGGKPHAAVHDSLGTAAFPRHSKILCWVRSKPARLR